MNLEVFCGGYIDLAVGGMTNQSERGLFLLVREGPPHLAISLFRGKLWLDRCLGDLKRGGVITAVWSGEAGCAPSLTVLWHLLYN